MILNRRALLAAIGMTLPAVAMAQTPDTTTTAKKKTTAKKTVKPGAKTAAQKAKAKPAAPTQG